MMVEQKHRTKKMGCAASWSLEDAFRLQKPFAKLLNDALYAILRCQIKKLSWSDPARGSHCPPKRSLPIFALIVFLGGAAGN